MDDDFTINVIRRESFVQSSHVPNRLGINKRFQKRFPQTPDFIIDKPCEEAFGEVIECMSHFEKSYLTNCVEQLALYHECVQFFPYSELKKRKKQMKHYVRAFYDRQIQQSRRKNRKM